MNLRALLALFPLPLSAVPAYTYRIVKPNMQLKADLIEFPMVKEPRGNLSFIEGSRHVPFDIKRVYYLYDVPGGSYRAGHAHKALHQILIAMSGSFDVTLDDGRVKQKFHLNRSYYGLHIYPMVWREIDNFSSGAVCLALASDYYEESDYYRDYKEFLEIARGK